MAHNKRNKMLRADTCSSDLEQKTVRSQTSTVKFKSIGGMQEMQHQKTTVEAKGDLSIS